MLHLVIASLLPSAAALQLASAPLSRAHGITMMAGAAPEELCRQIQSGSAASPDLSATLSTSAGARAFFAAYLKGDEWTCADSTEPPAILTEAIRGSTTTTLNVLLMNVVTSAAASSEPSLTRACTLISALWSDVPQLQLASSALQDAVAFSSGTPDKVAFDQNYEYMVEEWLGILNFSNYSTEQLGRVREALVSCAGARGVK